MSAQWLNTIGLVLTILGVLGLFRYGMPFHVPTGGRTFLTMTSTGSGYTGAWPMPRLRYSLSAQASKSGLFGQL